MSSLVCFGAFLWMIWRCFKVIQGYIIGYYYGRRGQPEKALAWLEKQGFSDHYIPRTYEREFGRRLKSDGWRA